MSLCDECDEADASIRCDECRASFCDDCSQTLHSLKKRRAHALVQLNLPEPPASPPRPGSASGSGSGQDQDDDQADREVSEAKTPERSPNQDDDGDGQESGSGEEKDRDPEDSPPPAEFGDTPPPGNQQQQQHDDRVDFQDADDITGIPGYEEFGVELTKAPGNRVGLLLGESGAACVVTGFLKSSSGGRNPAEECGRIHRGDVLLSVQGEVTTGLTVADVRARVREAASPVTLYFARGESDPDTVLGAWQQLEQARREGHAEHHREIIALVQDRNEYRLEVKLENFERFYQCAPATQEKIPVISFLGNTTTGKSYLLRAMMDEHEERPFCFEEDKMCSTTANANMYSTEAILGDQGVVLEESGAAGGLPISRRVNCIDFEGENGLTPFMNMVRKTKDLLRISKPETKQRHLAVKKFFPKISYLLSDVIILVGDTSLVNKDYFARCMEFALKANKGVSETMCKPSLLIVHNKCSLTAQFDMEETTREFMEAHILDEYDVVFDETEDEAPRLGFTVERQLAGGRPESSSAAAASMAAAAGGDGDAPALVITRVAEEGEAERGGLEVGDCLISINQEPAADHFDASMSHADIARALDALPRPVVFRFRRHDADAKGQQFLDFFAEVKCIRVPRGDIRQNIRGHWHNGDEILQQQIHRIRQTLTEMLLKQADMRREITVGERGWFFLLKAIVDKVGQGQPVSFTSLLNALLSTGDGDVDRLRTIFARVYELRAVRDLEWFVDCVRFAMEVFKRMISSNMRQQERSILTYETVSAQARKSLQLLLPVLRNFMPCSALYPGNTAFVCGQHKMFHTSGSHRTSVKVPLEGTRLQRLLSAIDGGRHMVWNGEFAQANAGAALFFESPQFEAAFVDGVYDYTMHPENSDATLRQLLDDFTDRLGLQFKVFLDSSMEHIPCLRCFKGCRTDSAPKTTLAQKLRMLQSHLELIYLSPSQLSVCSDCRPFFVEQGVLVGR